MLLYTKSLFNEKKKCGIKGWSPRRGRERKKCEFFSYRETLDSGGARDAGSVFLKMSFASWI